MLGGIQNHKPKPEPEPAILGKRPVITSKYFL